MHTLGAYNCCSGGDIWSIIIILYTRVYVYLRLRRRRNINDNIKIIRNIILYGRLVGAGGFIVFRQKHSQSVIIATRIHIDYRSICRTDLFFTRIASKLTADIPTICHLG